MLAKIKRGITRLWIVLAVAYDLYTLIAVMQEYGHEPAKDLLLFVGAIALMNVAWFVVLRVSFWIVEGFARTP